MTTKLFVSACLADESEGENISRMGELLDDIRNKVDSAQYMKMTDVIGVWHGACEASYCFDVTTLRQITLIKELAFKKYEQEAVLIVNAEGEGVLHYADGRMEYAGQWRELDPNERNPECYSIIRGKKYVCE